MKSKIIKVKSDLKCLKKNSLAIKRLIELQNIHFTRIKALEKLKDKENVDTSIKREEEIIEKMGIANLVNDACEIESKYMSIINSFMPEDKAIIIDYYLNGESYWRLALKYGFSEEGIRKHIYRLVEKIASMV